MTILLTQSWHPGDTDRTAPEVPDENGRPGAFHFELSNLSDAPVTLVRLCYASMTRPSRNVRVVGATITNRVANHVELSAEAPITLPPGDSWQIQIIGLTHAPLNHSQGAMAAWIEGPDGAATPVRCESLRADAPAGPRKDWPAGQIALPLALLPWPARAELSKWQPARPFSRGAGMPADAFDTVAALHQRLFPNDSPALTHQGGIPVRTAQAQMPAGGYALDFAADGVMLTHGDADGVRHGLIALAQIAHGALTDARFQIPAEGRIEDAPRFGWRGVHIDVARNFRPIEDLYRLADIAAWHRLNQLHLHLTDDEAWRLESKAFPELARAASTRKRGTSLAPQYADGMDGQSGYYTQEQMRALIALCTSLGIAITPELDLPGHTYAMMQAITGLHDQSEPWDCYRSVQGYPNNALNPGLERTFEVVEALLTEVCDLFPGPVVHVGGDEVDQRAWDESPAAQAISRAEGIEPGAMPLQAYFLRRVQAMLRARGKVMGGWDECAEGGGVDREGALLFAWRNVERIAQLLDDGYATVATPGQAYYLDMIQGTGWSEPGTSWAGSVQPEQTYRYEVTDGLPNPERLAGVHACIWAEHLNTRARWNYMVFPRLSAVAEAAWTPQGAKDWDRFCALSRLMPQL